MKEQDLGEQGMRAGGSRLRAWLEQRPGGGKVPLCLGASVVGTQDATRKLEWVERKEKWGGGPVFSATQGLVG